MNEETQLEAWMKENLASGQLEPLTNPASSLDIRRTKRAYSDSGDVIVGDWRPYEIATYINETPATNWYEMWLSIWQQMHMSVASGRSYSGQMAIQGTLGGNDIAVTIPILVYKTPSTAYSLDGTGGGYDQENALRAVITFTENFNDFTIYVNGTDVTANITINLVVVSIFYQIT